MIVEMEMSDYSSTLKNYFFYILYCFCQGFFVFCFVSFCFNGRIIDSKMRSAQQLEKNVAKILP